ncbi:hypothetical protein GCM10023107_00670 [Actinoplanes octamycinicus]
MTETGVDEIVPWAASRSVAQWRGDRGVKARDKWAATAREAAKQARRAWLPTVAGDPDCSTKQVAARLADAAAAFVLHEEATERLTAAALPAAGEIVLVVGPEGGISDAEVDTFRRPARSRSAWATRSCGPRPRASPRSPSSPPASAAGEPSGQALDAVSRCEALDAVSRAVRRWTP